MVKAAGALSQGRLLILCVLVGHGALAFSPHMPLQTASRSSLRGPCSAGNTQIPVRDRLHGRKGGCGATIMMADKDKKGFGRKSCNKTSFLQRYNKNHTCFSPRWLR